MGAVVKAGGGGNLVGEGLRVVVVVVIDLSCTKIERKITDK